MATVGGMSVGRGYDSRGTIRRWAGVSEAAVARMACVTEGTIKAWEVRYDDELPGRFRNDRGCQEVVERLANVYAALMWIAGGCAWPRVLEDKPLQAAVARMKL